MATAFTMQVDVEPPGRADEIADDLEEMGRRSLDWTGPFREIMRMLERDERRHFASLRGRYVLTGQTYASLTQPAANGAIREFHRGELHFGSRVAQAGYLTKSPRDPNNEQVSKPHRPDLRSAVLVFRGVTKKEASRVILDHVTEPWR
jgi:hypothetical protein